MNEAEIAFSCLVVSCCKPTGVLESVEAALDQVPEGIDGAVDLILCLAVPTHGDDRFVEVDSRRKHPCFHIGWDGIEVIDWRQRPAVTPSQ